MLKLFHMRLKVLEFDYHGNSFTKMKYFYFINGLD